MKPGKKGQMGPLGEDLVPVILMFLSLVVLVVALNQFFLSQLEKEEQTQRYEKAYALLEKKKSQWSLEGRNRLSSEKICTGCEKAKYVIKNMENNSMLCSCGKVDGNEISVSLPVALQDEDRILSSLLIVRV